MKYTYRYITQFEVADELRKGKQPRICDKLLGKVYKAEEMSAVDYIDMISSTDYSRFECWVVEPLADTCENKEEQSYVND